RRLCGRPTAWKQHIGTAKSRSRFCGCWHSCVCPKRASQLSMCGGARRMPSEYRRSCSQQTSRAWLGHWRACRSCQKQQRRPWRHKLCPKSRRLSLQTWPAWLQHSVGWDTTKELGSSTSACSGPCQALLGLKISGGRSSHGLQTALCAMSPRPRRRGVGIALVQELQVLVEEEQDIGVIGMVRSRFGTSPARHGVSATLKQVNFNQWELKALRHFKVLGPAEHDGDITRAKVEWVNDETSEEDVKLAETLVPLVDEWTATLMEMGKERYDGQLSDILKDLGDMPEAKAPGELAIWVAALVNPIPALGVAYEIRPAVLSASSVRERLEVAIEGIRGSIDHISGKRKLF
ncbi:unnamed protein product, partial [Symbiodinium sp. CCMP2456]